MMKLRLSIHGIWPLMNLISLSYNEVGEWLRITTTIKVHRHHHSESNVIALILINELASIGVLRWTNLRYAMFNHVLPPCIHYYFFLPLSIQWFIIDKR